MLPFLSDVDDTPVVETNYHLHDVDQNNVVRNSVQPYQLFYFRRRSLSQYLSWEFCTVIRSHLSPFLRRVSWLQITERFMLMTNNSAEKCATPFDGDSILKIQTLGICCAKFSTYILSKNHTIGSLYMNFFSFSFCNFHY